MVSLSQCLTDKRNNIGCKLRVTLHDFSDEIFVTLLLDFEVLENSLVLKVSHFSSSSRMRISVLLKISAHDGL